MSWEALAVSTGVVALAEMGDKTQLLALVLAARYRAPVAIIAGIFVATLLNHAAAGALGAWLASALSPTVLRFGLGASFIAMGVWMLIPDQPSATAERPRGSALGVFGITAVAFFVVEMGDKTQAATVMLAARYQALAAVVAGTTLGMLAANAPAVLLGERIVRWVPMRWVHRVCAAIFITLGALALLGAAP